MHQSVISHQVHLKQTDIPQNVILGDLRPIQDEDSQVYEDAAENTENSFRKLDVLG